MSISKKWFVLLIIGLMALFMPLTVVQAKEVTVYEQYDKNSPPDQTKNKQSPEPAKVSMVPYAMKFIGSFLLILALLFIVLKFLSKKSKMYAGGGPFHALGGHALGNNRSMQIVMVGDTLYLLGVGEDVNLIRMIPPGEEQTKLLAAIAEKSLNPVSNLRAQLKTSSQAKWDELLLKKVKEANSDIKQEEDLHGKGGGRI